MTKRFSFLYHDSGLYRFDWADLNRILVDREEMVRSEPDKVRDFAKATLNDLIGDATFRVYRYPEEDRDVADEARLSLVILDLHQVASEDEMPKATEDFVTGILKQHGKGFRKHANTLIFLAPDQHRASEVIDAARAVLALRSIDDDKTTKKQLSDEQLKDLAQRLKEAEARLPAALMTAYRLILVPAEKKTLRTFDMGISNYTGRTTLSSKVLEKLIEEQQVLKGLDPAILIGPRFALWPTDQEVINVKTLADYFTQLTHLPRLLGPDVLPACLAQGIHQGCSATPWAMARRSSSIRFTTRTNPLLPRTARSLSRHGFSGRSWPKRLCQSQRKWCRRPGLAACRGPKSVVGSVRPAKMGRGTWTAGGGAAFRLSRVSDG